MKEHAEIEPDAGKRVGSAKVLKLGSDCTGLGSDFVALKLALGSSVDLKTAFISDTWLQLILILVFPCNFSAALVLGFGFEFDFLQPKHCRTFARIEEGWPCKYMLTSAILRMLDCLTWLKHVLC